MKPLDRPLLRHDQVSALKEDKQKIEEVLNDPFLRTKIKQGEVRKRLTGITKMLTDQAPEQLTPQESNQLHAKEKALRAKITENMPPQEVMRKNPPGAVNWHRMWEKVNKPIIKQWKNIRRQLDPTSEDPDIANLERYRPQGEAGKLRTDAQIPGKMDFQSVPQENWDTAFEGKAPENTALKQAERVAKQRKPMSEENKQKARERLARAREAQRVKRMAAVHGEPAVDVDMTAVDTQVHNYNDSTTHVVQHVDEATELLATS